MFDSRCCHRENLSEGSLVKYSLNKNPINENYLQGTIKQVLGSPEQTYFKEGCPIKLENGDIGYAKEILDQEKINAETILELVKNDENQTLEFKASFSVNNETGEKLKCLKEATVKEVAAFMNTHGGIILIGVRNDGKILGIERDLKICKPDETKNETSEDLFKRTIEDAISSKLSPGKRDPDLIDSFHIFLIPILDEGQEKIVCVIKVDKMSRPVFMDIDVKYAICGEDKQKNTQKTIFYKRTPDSKVIEIDIRKLF
tara:strand:- start:2052 stop:2825 length:774 start_codon:yes stop_codon:yes gene_type:complete